MAKQSALKTKEIVASRTWLHYYNQVLFERGLITERERNKMALKINAWTGPGKPTA